MLAMPSVVSLVGVRLSQGVTAPGLGEGRVAALASRLIVSAKQAGILPLSSLDRRACGVAAPEASHGAFYFGLHICFGRGDLGSQGTRLASCEAERSWEEARSVTCLARAGFCSETLAIETFLCFHVWSTGLSSESSSSNFPWSK